MPNTLNLYDPLFYAQEGLMFLQKALGMAGRVYRNYDKAPQQKGSTIMIPVPMSFAATDVNTSTGGTTQDLSPGSTSIVLNKWKEVKFALTDKELTYTGGNGIINDHIMPAAYAIADQIDQDLCGLFYDIPWVSPVTATPAISDLTAARKIMFNNKVPLNDDRLHLMISGSLEAGLLNLQAFSQWQGAGNQAVETQMRGSIGRKFGFEVFSNQNVPSYLTGGDADVAGTITGAHAAGVTSLAIGAIGTTAGIKKGDTFVIAGNTQRYAVTANATASGGAIAALGITPPLAAALSGGEVITFDLPTTGATKIQNLAFHRDAFALAMAPLSELGNELGARIATVSDPVTGLSMRSRLFYNGDNSTVKVALDVLYGVKTLNPNLAVRLQE